MIMMMMIRRSNDCVRLMVSGTSGRNEPSGISLPYCWAGKLIGVDDITL